MPDAAILKRVTQLLNLAVADCNTEDPAIRKATEQESSVAALMACRLIVHHNLLSTPQQSQQENIWGEWGDDRGDDEGGVVMLNARFTSLCWCGKLIDVGTRIAWSRGYKTATATHVHCVEALRRRIKKDRSEA